MAKESCGDCAAYNSKCPECVTANEVVDIQRAIKDLDVEKLKAAIDQRARTRLERRMATLDAEIDKFIDRQFEQVIAMALGFKVSSWGEWEFDRYGDRASPALNFIRDAVSKHAEAKLQPFIDQVVEKELAKKGKKSWEGAVKNVFDDVLYKALENRARQVLQEEVSTKTDEIIRAISRKWGERADTNDGSEL